MCYFHDSTHKKRVYSLKIFTKVINFFILRFKGIKLKISYFRRRSAFSYSFPTKNVVFAYPCTHRLIWSETTLTPLSGPGERGKMPENPLFMSNQADLDPRAYDIYF